MESSGQFSGRYTYLMGNYSWFKIAKIGPVPGFAGEDYPIYAFPPRTSFQCGGLVGGYYADQEADCQSYHVCGEDGSIIGSKLCPNGTLYNQQYFICDWWFNVDCSVVSIILFKIM